DKDQAKLLRDSIATLCRVNPWIASILNVEAWKVSNPRTNAELTIISSDTATSFGLLPDIVVCDELTYWAEVRGEQLWHSLLSAAAEGENSLLCCIMNSGFVESFSWTTREKIKADPLWHFSHLDCSPSWITPARLDEQRRLLPPVVFSRLWENQWSSGAGD